MSSARAFIGGSEVEPDRQQYDEVEHLAVEASSGFYDPDAAGFDDVVGEELLATIIARTSTETRDVVAV